MLFLLDHVKTSYEGVAFGGAKLEYDLEFRSSVELRAKMDCLSFLSMLGYFFW